MKMNPKAAALSSMASDVSKTMNDAEDLTDNGADESTENDKQDTCCVKCACGADLLCADCKKPTCDCTC